MTRSKRPFLTLRKPGIFRPGPALSALLLIAFAAISGCDDDNHDHDEPWQVEVDKLRAAIESYDNFDNAEDDGYKDEVTGYRAQMGFHYLKTSILDDKFELEHPELLLYVPDGHGGLRFVAVEYAVPIADMDNPPPAPEGFTGDKDAWEINTEFELWTLHVWTNMENPHGIFHPHNPDLP